MHNIYDVPRNELGDIFKQTALKVGMSSPSIIEKDFWLVKLLQLLFSNNIFIKHHVFKGGTSLSKCFGLIQRFSEDVDITISKALLGFHESIEEVSILGDKKRKRYFNELISAAVQHVKTIAFTLEKQLESRIDHADWQLYVDSNDKQQIIFEYPKSLEQSMYPDDAYVKPKILLEFGCRGALEPASLVNITTYIEQSFSEIFSSNKITVNALNPERTFWEKITLLHMLAHKSDDKPPQPRMARHYYDIYKLSKSEVIGTATKNIPLLESVATHKSIYFRSKQASYETAKPGSLKLVPNQRNLKALESDYNAMKDMFFQEKISFNDIFTEITLLEKNLNTLKLEMPSTVL